MAFGVKEAEALMGAFDRMADRMKKLEESSKSFRESEKRLKKESEALSGSLKLLGGEFDEASGHFKIGKKRVNEYGQELNHVGDIITAFNKRTAVLSKSIKELSNRGQAFEIFSSETLKEYRQQGGNILEYIAEGLSGTREEITILGVEGAKARRVMYGFLPPGMFRLINKLSSVFQLLGGSLRRASDTGSKAREELKKLREERDKHKEGSDEYIHFQKAVEARLKADQGRMSLTVALFKQLKKIPNPNKELVKGARALTDIEARKKSYESGKLGKELSEKRKDILFAKSSPIRTIENTNSSRLVKMLGEGYSKNKIGGTRLLLKKQLELTKGARKFERQKAIEALESQMRKMEVSREKRMSIKYDRSLRTKRGNFGGLLPNDLKTIVKYGVKQDDLIPYMRMKQMLKDLKKGRETFGSGPALRKQEQNIKKLLDASSSIRYMMGEIAPAALKSFERTKKLGILAKLFLLKNALAVAKLGEMFFKMMVKNPKKIAEKTIGVFGKMLKGVFKMPFQAVMLISRFIIMGTGYLLYYGIIIAGLIIALKKPVMAGLSAFKETFSKFVPVILFAVSTVWGGFKKIYEGFKSGDLFVIIEGVLQIAFGLLLGLWAVALGVWAAFISFVGDFVNKLFVSAADYVKQFLDGFGANYETLKKALVIITLVAALFFSWPAVAVGLLAMAGVVLGKKLYDFGKDNWTMIKTWLGDKLDAVIDAINPVKQGQKLIDSITDPFKMKTLKSGLSIPAFANGGISKGGMALVGERGPELVNLPRGARVHSNAESRKMAGNTFNITINARDTSKAEMRRIAESLGRDIASKINRTTSSSTFR